jgi:CheY-like chemotaxis protein
MMLLRRTLTEYNLLEAATAEEALQLFARHDPHVDLLLTDVTLPTSSGYRWLIHFAQRRATCLSF